MTSSGILENKESGNILDVFFKNTFLEIWADKIVLGSLFLSTSGFEWFNP